MNTVLMLVSAYVVGHVVGAVLRRQKLRRELSEWGGEHFADRFFNEKGQDDRPEQDKDWDEPGLKGEER